MFTVFIVTTVSLSTVLCDLLKFKSFFFLPNYVLWAVRHRADRLCSPFGVLFFCFFSLAFSFMAVKSRPKKNI